MRNLLSLAVLVVSLPATPALAQVAPEPLSRATFTADMDRQFGEIDTDKDRIISPAEIAAARGRAAGLMADRRAKQLFAGLDTDKNGSLSPTEFAKVLKVDADKLPPAPVLQFDKNKDGKVSKAEYDAGAGANFAKLDRNGDGTVSVAETAFNWLPSR